MPTIKTLDIASLMANEYQEHLVSNEALIKARAKEKRLLEDLREEIQRYFIRIVKQYTNNFDVTIGDISKQFLFTLNVKFNRGLSFHINISEKAQSVEVRGSFSYLGNINAKGDNLVEPPLHTYYVVLHKVFEHCLMEMEYLVKKQNTLWDIINNSEYINYNEVKFAKKIENQRRKELYDKYSTQVLNEIYAFIMSFGEWSRFSLSKNAYLNYSFDSFTYEKGRKTVDIRIYRYR